MDNLDAEIIAWISKALVVKGGPGSGPQPGHPFLGNQYASGSGGGGGEKPAATKNWGDKNVTRASLKDVKVNEGETKTAAQVMEAVTRYADANPDTMNGYSDKESHEKFIAEHEDAIPKWLIDKVTQKDVDVLEDNNYHTANTVIASQRPDLKGWTNEKALAQWDTQKSASEISKGDLPGHEFRGNQYTTGQAASALRDLATSARAANEKSRLKSDVLGVSGPRESKSGERTNVHPYSTPRYLESQTDNAKSHNEAIAGHAEALAQRIESDPSKPVAEHIADFRDAMAKLSDQGRFHTGVDNYDTGASYFRAANAGSAVANHISQGPKSDTPEPKASSETEYAGGTTSEIARGLQEGIRSGEIRTPMDMDNYLYDAGFDGDPTELF